MTFDYTPYGTKTTKEAQEEIRKFNNSLKNYALEITNKQHEQNFFIFKHKEKKQYIRICLMSNDWHEKKVFYWSVDSCFKPLTKNKQNKQFNSGYFGGSYENIYLIYLKECIKFIRRELK